MLERDQVFVRALNAQGKWDTVDVLDLDEESFRRFVLTKLDEAGMVTAVYQTPATNTPLRAKPRK